MPLFDEIREFKKLDDPEERKVQELARGEKNFGRSKHIHSSSVTVSRYTWTIRIVVAVLALAVLVSAGFFIYTMINSFIPSGS